MILQDRHYAEFPAVPGALTEAVYHPARDLFPGVSPGNALTGEHTQHRRAQAGGTFNPRFHQLHLGSPSVTLRMGEIIPDTRAADIQPQKKGLAFDRIEIRVVGNSGVAGKVIGGGVHCGKVEPGAELDYIIEFHLAALERPVEGIEIAAEFHECISHSRGWCLSGTAVGSVPPPRNRSGRRRRCGLQEISSVHRLSQISVMRRFVCPSRLNRLEYELVDS